MEGGSISIRESPGLSSASTTMSDHSDLITVKSTDTHEDLLVGPFLDESVDQHHHAVVASEEEITTEEVPHSESDPLTISDPLAEKGNDPLDLGDHEIVTQEIAVTPSTSRQHSVNRNQGQKPGPNHHGMNRQVFRGGSRSPDVRVDNWGNYCFQRLQAMYDRGDYCDLVLQFHTGETLKVHRVVVNLITDYFSKLEEADGGVDGVLMLPEDMEYNVMLTIVKFFYTGKLEVKGALYADIYKTVKKMNILILTKLLEAHLRKPDAMKRGDFKPVSPKQEFGRALQKLPNHQGSPGSTFKIASPGGAVSFNAKTLSRPLPPGVKTQHVLARVQPKAVRVGGGSVKVVTQKRSPTIWRERTVAPVTNSEAFLTEKWPIRDEPARPTRFEWPENDEDMFLSVPTTAHVNMDKPKETPLVVQPPKPVVQAPVKRSAQELFDAVVVKRGQGEVEFETRADGPRAKLAKVELLTMQHMEEESATEHIAQDLAEEHQGMTDLNDVNLTEETVVEEVVSTSDNENTATDHLSNHIEVPSAVIETTVTSSPSTVLVSKPTTSRAATLIMPGSSMPRRSSLKSPGVGGSGAPKVEKCVRFAPEVEKENKTKAASSSVAPSRQIIMPKSNQGSSTPQQIINEVLKKYPELVKDQKNIKLQIVQKKSDLPSVVTKDSKSKVSYIVLKSNSSPDSSGTVVPKKTPAGNKTFWDSDKEPKKPPSGAENTTGPWMCTECGEASVPIEFVTYHDYRRHLVDVHNERIDARICEYCGQKQSKRNLLLYHLYTKHGIPPPPNCVFPSCDRCDYIALSSSLLAKHRQTHDANKELPCQECTLTFKTDMALQEHMVAGFHRHELTKVFECPYCRKPFVRVINLKGHIRQNHRDIARPEQMDDPKLSPETEVVSHASGAPPSRKRQFPTILSPGRGAETVIEEHAEMTGVESYVRLGADGQSLEIIQGVDPNTPVLVQSSEAETLSSVASSITASLGLDSHGQPMGTEYVTDVQESGQAVYIMDTSQNTMQMDLSGLNVGVTQDGQVIFEGQEQPEHFVVQDLHGNQYRKMTGIDQSTGKQVIFFQLQDANGQVQLAPAIIDDGGDGTTQYAEFDPTQQTFSIQNDHMYMESSSDGVTLPVTVAPDVVSGQVLISSIPATMQGGHVLQFHTDDSGTDENHGGLIVSQEVIDQGGVQLHVEDNQNNVMTSETVEHLQMQEQVHIVLDQHNSPEAEADKLQQQQEQPEAATETATVDAPITEEPKEDDVEQTETSSQFTSGDEGEERHQESSVTVEEQMETTDSQEESLVHEEVSAAEQKDEEQEQALHDDQLHFVQYDGVPAHESEIPQEMETEEEVVYSNEAPLEYNEDIGSKDVNMGSSETEIQPEDPDHSLHITEVRGEGEQVDQANDNSEPPGELGFDETVADNQELLGVETSAEMT